MIDPTAPNLLTSSDPRLHGKRWIRARILKLTRTLHIYLTLLGVAGMTFFAVTGFILNHDEWFDRGKPITRIASGQLPTAMLRPIDKLAIAERLRADFHITGAVVEFTTDPDAVRVTYKGPGRRTDASIDPATGIVDLTFESRGLIGRITDLHKGTDSGEAWKWVIDVVAVLIVIGALTGVLMWWHLPKRRFLGMASILLGVAISVVLYWLAVP